MERYLSQFCTPPLSDSVQRGTERERGSIWNTLFKFHKAGYLMMLAREREGSWGVLGRARPIRLYPFTADIGLLPIYRIGQ